MENQQLYYIHDNYSRPFKVIVNSKANILSVYKLVIENSDSEHSEQSDHTYEYHPSYVFEFIDIFIGKSPLIAMTEYSGGYGDNFTGNSILLKTKENYIYIGNEIYAFVPGNDIIEYVSPVGNNDVPYPYAIDNNGNIYLMAEDVILINTDQMQQKIKEYDNPYDYYYEYKLITPNLGYGEYDIPKSGGFKNIKEFYIGNEQYTLTYSNDFSRLEDEDEMYVVYFDSKDKVLLTKDDFIELMTSYGKYMGFDKIDKKAFNDLHFN